MATAIIPARPTGVAVFEPHQTRVNVAKADAMITLAQQLHDWPLLETAVDQKIAEQAEFVGWWDAKVTGNRHRVGRPENSVQNFLSVAQAEKLTRILQPQVSRWRKRLADIPKYRETMLVTMWRKAMSKKGQSDLRGASGAGDNEWFTPTEYVERARKVLGTIDLDPASHPEAQRAIKAKAFYTEADDGLSREWRGKVWLNPPYAQPAIGHFADKMVMEVAADRVTEAVMLTHNYTDTAWFQALARAATAICFTKGRIRFVSPSGEIAAPTQGQAFFYFGKRLHTFAAHFSDIGFVMVRTGI